MNSEPVIHAPPDWVGFDADLRSSPDAPDMGTDADFARFAVDGMAPERVVCPASVSQVCRVMAIASAQGVAVVPVGFGAHLGAGAAPRRPFLALSLASLNALVDHQPGNMTLTAQAGMSLARLQGATAGSGQWLPVDPPFPDQTSVGGLISANLSGPCRFSQGTVRDLLIGITVVRADGSVVKSGGRVVKNVAGYDLGKLYCGALGTLGVIVEASFKVRTLPQARAAARITCPNLEAAQDLVERILKAPLEPLFIELSGRIPAAGTGCVLVVGFGGAGEDVADQAVTLRSLVDGAGSLEELADEEAEALMTELRDSRAGDGAFFGLKASLPTTKAAAFIAALEEEGRGGGLAMAVQAHAGNGIIHVRIERPDEPPVQGSARAIVERLRAAAASLGGTLVVEHADPAIKPGLDLWGSGIEGLALMKRIKQTMDPGGILSPGRFVGGI
ncbi:MAG: FAD-binding oxidoreductase [Deltaproteobacteria bacterium]|nr:FAD-binding oxidoreductase [Deltaproteobacteria bacterium]